MAPKEVKSDEAFTLRDADICSTRSVTRRSLLAKLGIAAAAGAAATAVASAKPEKKSDNRTVADGD
jgi:hypothetical protein